MKLSKARESISDLIDGNHITEEEKNEVLKKASTTMLRYERIIAAARTEEGEVFNAIEFTERVKNIVLPDIIEEDCL